MSRWWRAYDEAVDDPKLCLLTDKQHRAWFNLCCITSQNGGKLPAMAAVAFKLRMTIDRAKAIVAELVALGLVDMDDVGTAAPHNWNARQYKSDVSTERVKRFRNAERNVSETPNETPPETEQIQRTESEKKDSCAVAPATRPKVGEEFEEFWKAYPKREGANPKAPARKSFLAALKAGTEASEIVAGARACAARDRDKIGTPFIPQAVKWLRDRRWEDYAATGPPVAGGAPQPPRPDLPSHEEMLKRYANGRQNPPGTSSEISPTGGGISPETPERRADDHQARHAGMASVGAVLSRIPGIRAGSDEADQHRPKSGQGDDGSDAMARVV